MLAKVINQWTFDGKNFLPNDFVDISPKFFSHLSATNIVEKVKGKIPKKTKVTVLKI